MSQISGALKNAQRYIAVAKAPSSLQRAFEKGFLPLVSAAAVGGLEARAREGLGKAIAELLNQTEVLGDKVVKKQVCETVRAALDKAKRNRRRKAGPSPMDPLYALSRSLEGHLGEME